MKKVLYISYDGMTDPLGQSQVIPYLQGLSKLGYGITLLSAEKPDRFAEGKEKIGKLLKDSGIEWVPVPYTSQPKVLSTVYDVWNLISTAKKLHKKNNYSIVHCRSYIAAMAGQTLKRKYGVKFLFDMRGFWADERIDGGIWNLGNPLFKRIYNYFKKKEKEYFTEADHSISLTEAGKREIHTWKELNNPVPIQVIPCCADLGLFDYNAIDPHKLAALNTQFGYTEDDLVITYLGSLGTWYMLDEMLALFAKIKTKHPNAKMHFVTADEPQMVFAKTAQYGLNNSDIKVNKAARNDVPYYIAIGKVSMFFVKQAYSKLASSPTKMGEIMGLGVPIICNAGVGDVKEITEDTGAGICIDDFSDTELQRAADNLSALLTIPKSTIRNGALKYYSLQKGVEKYATVYQKLLQQ
ncbi:MAG: glycosyltransferase [Sphingobacteriales bacterium JAD_PAG50586_3]|nr:MAG: glycosyltransferase [Sphingobacteriales bacterium JAD_PAG50586_3]